MSYKDDLYNLKYMRSETIDNDDDNLPPSKEKKESLLVENKQPEEPLTVGEDFETEVLEEKDDDENISTVPTKQKEDESLSRIKPEKRKEKKKD